ncbi:MAG: phosphotransferase [Bdellovibrionales bacterium]|nr:phosphotransferase [Bdellovibrionales bacterium]
MTKTDLLRDNLKQEIFNFLESYFQSHQFQIVPLAGDASNRRYYRVICANNSFVLMDWEPFTADDSYPFLSVHRLFRSHKVSVPEILSMKPEHGLMLLEDLGDLTLERKFWESHDPQSSMPFYQLTIDELLKIHYSTALDEHKTSTAFHIRFTHDKLLWEMNYGKTHLIEGLNQYNLSPSEMQGMNSTFDLVCQVLANEQPVVCHRDYHSRNVMIKLGKLRVIDFQDARLGPAQYDLVSLLEDSYVQLPPDMKRFLLNYYLEKAQQEFKMNFNLDHFYKIYRIQLIQRCFKACGSFASFYNIRKDDRYLKYIQPTLKKVYDTLISFEEFKDFSRLLENSQALNRDYKKLCME